MKILGSVFVVFALLVGCSSKKNSLSAENNNFIIGGDLVTEGSTLAQSIVGIYDDNEGFTCTGSLLPNNLVLTAAHCVGKNPRAVYIVFAPDMERILNMGINFKKHPSVRQVTAMKAHEKWNFSQDSAVPGNDIALMKYAGSTPQGYVSTKVLQNTSLITPGAQVTLAGYGVDSDVIIPVDPKKTKNLQELIDNAEVFCDTDDAKTAKECVKEELSGPAILKSTEVVVTEIPNDNEVILDQTQGHAACSGDSGGPAYIKVGEEYQLWGITSRSGIGCNKDIIYTNAISYGTWIKLTAQFLRTR